MMQFDAAHGVTLGNAITILVVVFGAGGTYAAIKAGLASTNEKLADLKADQAEGLKQNEQRFDYIEKSIEEIKNTYVPERIDKMKDELTDYRLKAIEDMCRNLSRIITGPPK